MTEVLPDGAALDELFGPSRLAAVARTRGTTNPAVAATLLFEQYAQRLVAPVLAAWHRHGAMLDARAPRIRAQVVDGSLRRLAFADPPEPGGDPDLLLARLVGRNLDPVADSLHRGTRAGSRVLRGTMANAVAGSLLHLSWPAWPSAPRSTRPANSPAAAAVPCCPGRRRRSCSGGRRRATPSGTRTERRLRRRRRTAPTSTAGLRSARPGRARPG